MADVLHRVLYGRRERRVLFAACAGAALALTACGPGPVESDSRYTSVGQALEDRERSQRATDRALDSYYDRLNHIEGRLLTLEEKVYK